MHVVRYVETLSETQLGVGLLQEETLGSAAGVEAILADRGRYEAGQPGYPGLSHGSQHGVSLRREDVRSEQDLRIDGDSFVQAIHHGNVRQSQRSIHRSGEDRVSSFLFFLQRKLVEDRGIFFFFADCIRCSTPVYAIVR